MSRHKIMLGMPGGKLDFGSARGLMTASTNHDVCVDNSSNGWDDMTALFTLALQRAEDGEITHYAQLHADIEPQQGWLDILAEECDRFDADMISSVSPLKDDRGLTSSGIGVVGCPWTSYRRLAVRELHALPGTFSPDDFGYRGFVPLHNSGCFILDLRKPVFTKQEGDQLALCFAFPQRIVRHDNKWKMNRESEDWYFSRKLHEHGGKGLFTNKISLVHRDGNTCYANHGDWGKWEHDEETRVMWETGPLSHLDIEGWFDFADLYRDQVKSVNGKPAHFVEVGSWLGKSAAFMGQQIAASEKRIRFDAIDNWIGGTNSPANCGKRPSESATREAVANRGDLFDKWNKNIKAAGVDEYVRPVRGDSTETASQYPDRSLDFVFIDADHEAAAVYSDLTAWLPKIRPGGTIAGHDFDENGPKEGATRFFREKAITLKTNGKCFMAEVAA